MRLFVVDLGKKGDATLFLSGKQDIYMGIAIETIEDEIRKLPQDQLKKFRAWYEKIEKDMVSGKLDALANAAIADHNDGRSTKL